MRPSLWFLCLSLLADSACTGDVLGSAADASSSSPDAQNPQADAASSPDASVAPRPDAGTPGADAASPGADAAVLPTGTPAADEIRVNETKRFQTMDGIGAASYAFPYANDIGWTWSSAAFVFDELQLRYIRLAPWFGFWEQNNDNSDPSSIEWSALGTNGITANHDVAYSQFLTRKNVEMMLGVWDVADWLAGDSPRAVAPSMYPELGESIASYLVNLQNKGVPQKFVEVQNEPDITAAIQYPSPQALRDAALAVVDQLDRNGLTGVKLHGPNLASPNNVADWAAVWLADSKLKARTAAISYHTWWVDSFGEYDAIRQIADSNGLPVWATEVGYCALTTGCFGGTHFLRPETWGTAWDYAMSHYRAIAWSHASRTYHWTVLGHDAVVSTGGQRYPSFYVLKQFANYIPPGAVFVDGASGDAGVLVLAFVWQTGEVSAVLLNTGSAPKTMRLTSVRGDAWSRPTGATTADGSFEIPPQVGGSGPWRVTLPAQSVTSLKLVRQ